MGFGWVYGLSDKVHLNNVQIQRLKKKWPGIDDCQRAGLPRSDARVVYKEYFPCVVDINQHNLCAFIDPNHFVFMVIYFAVFLSLSNHRLP